MKKKIMDNIEIDYKDLPQYDDFKIEIKLDENALYPLYMMRN